jgi:hypothetical protein
VATSVPTLVRDYQNPRETNMKKHTRGFIPLVAIVLLGLIAVAGGVIAAVSIHNKAANRKEQTSAAATSTPTTTTDAAYSAPVQARVQSSEASSTQRAGDATSTRVAQTVRPIDPETAQDCQESQVDLADVKANGVQENTGGDQIQASQQQVAEANKAISLLETIAGLCNTLKKPSPNTADGDAKFLSQEITVKQQFDLYQESRVAQ